MKSAKALSLFYLILMLFNSCSKDDASDPSTVVGVTPPASINRSIEFLFTPDGRSISGKGKIYYDNNGSKTYVFGTELNPSSWTGVNTSQSTSIYSSIPPGVLVHYSFTSDPASTYSPPIITIKYHASGSSINTLVPASHALTGSFNSPQ